jgi:hypothetical protein
VNVTYSVPSGAVLSVMSTLKDSGSSGCSGWRQAAHVVAMAAAVIT